jgi:hypothetical protein
MELNLQPRALACFVSGQPFREGDRVASLLVEDGRRRQIVRYDALEANAARFTPEGFVACRWVQVFKPQVRPRRTRPRAQADGGHLFLTLSDPSTLSTPETDRLVRFLALLLERKRVLLHLRHGERPEVEEGGGEGGAGPGLLEDVGKVLEAPGAPAGDDRHLDGVADPAGELEVVAGLGAVAVHAGEEDLARAELDGPSAPIRRRPAPSGCARRGYRRATGARGRAQAWRRSRGRCTARQSGRRRRG